MDQPLGLLLAFVALVAVLFGLFASLGAFFPRWVWLSQRAAEQSPGRSLLIGSVNAAFVLAISLPLLSLEGPLATLLGALVLALGTGALAIGLAAVASLVGRRLRRSESELSSILTGTVVLSLGSAVPFLGWFVFLPGVIFLGLGACILGWFRRRAWSGQL
ncbi:MAG TPA: hypothetical protein VLL77_04595 [Anaerolineales bacterium]|nr:hypothetical protein [Anaerolineales bacterium]